VASAGKLQACFLRLVAWAHHRLTAGAHAEGGTTILPKSGTSLRTIRRGGTLTYSNHQLLTLWAATCAEHVLDLFEVGSARDPRPRQAIEHARAWVRGEAKMMEARAAGGHAMGDSNANRSVINCRRLFASSGLMTRGAERHLLVGV
jgi:hypothetical protein